MCFGYTFTLLLLLFVSDDVGILVKFYNSQHYLNLKKYLTRFWQKYVKYLMFVYVLCLQKFSLFIMNEMFYRCTLLSWKGVVNFVVGQNIYVIMMKLIAVKFFVGLWYQVYIYLHSIEIQLTFTENSL